MYEIMILKIICMYILKVNKEPESYVYDQVSKLDKL